MGSEVTVGVVARRGAERAQELAGTLVSAVEGRDVTVLVDEATASAVTLPGEGVPVDRMAATDLIVSIGGDGTLLFVVREAGPTPVVGVNLGEVGFLNAVAPDEAVETVTSLVETLETTGSLDCTPLPRLQTTAADGSWELTPALNDVVVQGPVRGPGGGATVTVSVDGDRYASTRADGVVVATATGSTAYSLSEGGPLVGPDLDAVVVSFQCGRAGNPSLVVSPEREIAVEISDADAAYAVADGRARRTLQPPTSVVIRQAEEPARLAGPSVDFFAALDKLD